ncbi:hypothetical protein HH212_26675 (plasmid) [Massilia forsythiae]|uniref:Uncharacterized protein n=1 Tax=Massilia forsythiae TaxID=2728020 RepID=A0A7Z2W3B9_9BURK|nr:hypothetical protein [Massilia forsythiae]QJE03682.1 hypothetical protein HH212_26675 [Massilia forsythiae]
MFNFAVTLAAVSDWTFHLAVSQQPAWNGKREQHFTNWVRHSNSDASVFIDISNEYKHANRNKSSTLARKMMLKAVWPEQDPTFFFNAAKMLKWKMSNGGDLIGVVSEFGK